MSTKDLTAVSRPSELRAPRPDTSAVRRQLDRMSASRAFAKAGRMFPLLEYLLAAVLDDDILIDVPRGRYAAEIEVRHSVAHLYRDELPEQTIHYCETPDGIRIAYATIGAGYPLICLPHWLSHLEADAANPFVRLRIPRIAVTHST